MPPKDKKLFLEELLQKSMKKVGVSKENDLCRYIPSSKGDHVHHFTLRKWKAKDPDMLAASLEKHILQIDKPKALPPKSRAPRGSRSNGAFNNFTRHQLERMLNIAKLAGDTEIITILSPKKSLAVAKKELLQSIRRNRADEHLWQAYANALQVLEPTVK